MDPSSQVPYPLAPGSQTVWYSPWLKVLVALWYVRTFPWHPTRGGRSGSTFRGFLAEEFRLRRAGWFN
jgi:hypothetical protein